MTDNNTVYKLQQAQNGLESVNKSLAQIKGSLVDLAMALTTTRDAVSKLLPLIESASHDVAWQEVAPKPLNAAEPLVKTFDSWFDPFGVAKVRTNENQPPEIPIPTTHDLVYRPPGLANSIVAEVKAKDPSATGISSPAGIILFDGVRHAVPTSRDDNLTLQAVKLLERGDGYYAVIDQLTAKYPSMKRDNVRRAVGRARDRV